MNAAQLPAISLDARRYWRSVERSAQIGLPGVNVLANVALRRAQR